jgi:hypothetical protein
LARPFGEARLRLSGWCCAKLAPDVSERSVFIEAAAPRLRGGGHGAWPCARRWCGIAGDGDAVIKREQKGIWWMPWH